VVVKRFRNICDGIYLESATMHWKRMNRPTPKKACEYNPIPSAIPEITKVSVTALPTDQRVSPRPPEAERPNGDTDRRDQCGKESDLGAGYDAVVLVE
jgi:hypothetical protein